MTILVGYVPTPEGEAALAAGLEEARLRSTGLIILNSPRQGATVDAALATDEEIEQLLDRARTAGVEATVRRSEHGADLAEEFLRLAEETEASLVVIGLRRRSQVGKFIMGSHAQRILLQMDRPVLAVKVPEQH